MALTLLNLGIEVNTSKNDTFRENMIQYCLEMVNGIPGSISSQSLLSNSNMINEDLKIEILTKLSRDMIGSRNNLLNRLKTGVYSIEMYNFISKYMNGLKKIYLTLKLDNNNKFITDSIELLIDMIILNVQFRKYLKEYIYEIINKKSNNKLLKYFSKFEKYNIVIFEEIAAIIVEWSLQKINVPDEYPLYMKEIYRLNIYIKRVKNVNKFIDIYFPVKNHSDILVPLFDKIYDKLDILIEYKFTSEGLLSRFLSDLCNQIYYLSNDKYYYFESMLIKRLNLIFDNIERINSISNYCNLYKNYNYTQNGIERLFNRCKDEYLKNILFTILSLKEKDIETFIKILVSIESVKNIFIRLKILLGEYIWKLTSDECIKIKNFCYMLNSVNNISENKIINIMIENKINSNDMNLLIQPHEIFHFTPGVWDFPLKNDFIIINDCVPCFKEELNALFLPTISYNKEMIVFMTKGKMLFELNDSKKKLDCEFLPIQGFVVQELLNKKNITYEEMISFIQILGIKNYQKVLQTLQDIIQLKNNIYTFKSELPDKKFINFAERYFTEIYEIIEKEIKIQCNLSLLEILSSNICSITKKSDDCTIEIDKLFDILNKNVKVIKFTKLDFEKVLCDLEKKDYIIKNDEMITYQIY